MRMAGLESVVLGTCLEITRDDQEIFTAVLAHLGAPGCMLRVFPSCSQLDLDGTMCMQRSCRFKRVCFCKEEHTSLN